MSSRSRRLFLKIKIASLAAESRIISEKEKQYLARCRQARIFVASSNPAMNHVASEELRELDNARFELQEHRKKTVRPASRHALLALGFLRGRTFPMIEQRTRRDRPFGYDRFSTPKPANPIDWKAVADNVKRFGHGIGSEAAVVAREFAEWQKKAEETIASRMSEIDRDHNRRPKGARVKRTLAEWQALQEQMVNDLCDATATPGCCGGHAVKLFDESVQPGD